MPSLTDDTMWRWCRHRWQRWTNQELVLHTVYQFHNYTYKRFYKNSKIFIYHNKIQNTINIYRWQHAGTISKDMKVHTCVVSDGFACCFVFLPMWTGFYGKQKAIRGKDCFGSKMDTKTVYMNITSISNYCT